MSEQIPAVGEPIQARCTKCKQNTDSVIVSVSETGPEKVQCSLCSRKHKYRPPTAAKKVTRRAPAQGEADRKQWETLLGTMDSSKAVDYSMSSALKLNVLVSHPVFGLGMVQRLAGPQKAEVLFESGRKTMRCK